MTFRYFHGVCAAVLLLSVISCGSSRHSGRSKNVLPGTWQSQPIVIDGDSKDWPSPYPNYDAKARVGYATSNDKRNLYITVETGDEMTQMKILKQGMTVSIDTSGKKDPGFNINYPILNDNDPMDMPGSEGHKNQSHFHTEGQWSLKISKLAKEDNQFTLDGFGTCNGGYLVSQATKCGIKVMMRIDEYKELVWEAAIPFKAIYGVDSISSTDAGRPISVCFAINRFKHPESKSTSENNSGGMGMNNGMGGGARGGGRGGGGGRNVSEDPLQHLYENTKNWKQFSIAWQQ